MRKIHRIANHKQQSQDKVIRKLSLSTSKLNNKLSLSFYDQSTLKKNKQIIVDPCPLQNHLTDTLSQDPILERKKTKTNSKTKRKKIGLTVYDLFKDKIDREITATTASKMASRQWEQKQKEQASKKKIAKAIIRQTGTSLDKYRHDLVASILQGKSKISKPLFQKRQMHHLKKN